MIPDSADLRSENFFIREGYRANINRVSDASTGENYWSDWRIRESRRYQYDVYILCRRLLKQMQSPSLLEIGCGPAIKTRELLASNCSEVVLMDQPETRSLVARSFPASAFHGLDLESANLELDREFDMILCADVLEHLTNPTPCLELISRHMAKSSIAVLSTPERDNLRGDACTACLKSDHVREWNAREFRRYVESLGFEVIEQCLCPQVRQSIFRHLTRWASGNAQRRAVWLGCQVITVRLEQSAMRRNP